MATSPTGSFYRHLIRNAWKVVRANPLLWIFGFFVSFLGNGGIYELLVQGTGRLGLQQDFGGLVALAYLVPNEADVWRILTGQGGIGLAAMVVILFLVAILACVVIWAVVSSQGALITGVRDAANRFLYFIGTMEDIRERKQAEAKVAVPQSRATSCPKLPRVCTSSCAQEREGRMALK